MRKPAFSLFIASASGHYFLKLFYLLTITVQGNAYCLFSSFHVLEKKKLPKIAAEKGIL